MANKEALRELQTRLANERECLPAVGQKCLDPFELGIATDYGRHRKRVLAC